MATSAQIADTPSNSSVAPTPGPAKFSVASALVFILLGAAIASLGFGGALYYLARSGRLHMRGAAVQRSNPSEMARTHLMALDPLLVNLADNGGNSYLRLSMTLQVAEAAANNNATPKDEKSGDSDAVAVRDTALTVLGRQTSDGLLAPDGKDRLKEELKKAVAEHNPNLKVKKLFFTDFLVQR